MRNVDKFMRVCFLKPLEFNFGEEESLDVKGEFEAFVVSFRFYGDFYCF